MMNETNPNATTRLSLAGVMLPVLGVICTLVAVIGTIQAWELRSDSGTPPNSIFFAWCTAAMIGGFALGGVLIGLGALTRLLERLTSSIAETTSSLDADDPLASTRNPASLSSRKSPNMNGTASLEENSSFHILLREIRDLSAIAPGERDASVERIRNNFQKHNAEDIIEAVNRRQLGRARIMLRDAEAIYGPTPTFERLSVKIEEADTRTEPLDFARTKRLVEEAMVAKRWVEAEEFVEALSHNHPSSGRCRQLWEDTRRARLLAHVQRCASQHHWAEGVAAAEEFLERFPDSVESKSLRQQLDTIRENAEIVQRRQIETRITELLGSQHFEEALRLAKHVVETFPDSPQAEALREQLPKLQKRVTA